MNLQTTIPQTIPFPVSKTSYEDLFPKKMQIRQMVVPTQQRAAFIPAIDEPRIKENLVLSPEAVLLVGENGKHRFDEFKRFPKGWYGGRGREISKYSVAVFESFIKKIPELRLFRPSLFLTIEGNISLGLEDKNQKNIEIEFYPDKVEYFVESLHEEASIGIVGIFELAGKIKKLLQ